EQPGALVVDDRAHRMGAVGVLGGRVEELAAAEELVTFCGRARKALRSRFGLALRSVLHECDPLRGGRVHGMVLDIVVNPTIEHLV
ncbi:hypothetical protein ABZ372_48200, partial [Streptomyces sp. NPDC005921]